MSKVLQVVVYKEILDEEKLAAYSAIAGPAMISQGGCFLARGMPVAVKEAGRNTRTVVIEWPSMAAADAAYNSDGYQAALKALDGGAVREFRYVEVV